MSQVPPPTSMPPTAKPPGEQKALIALILGIASFICTPIAGIVSIVVGKQAEQEGYTGSKVRIGRILSFISFAYWALILIGYVIFFVILATTPFFW